MKMDNEKFIVAEVTKNWPSGTPVNNLLSQQFETVINVNVQRGYKLIDWKINVSSHPDLLTETIIAIFEFLGSEPEGKEAVEFADSDVRRIIAMVCDQLGAGFVGREEFIDKTISDFKIWKQSTY